MTKRQNKTLRRILAAAVLYALLFFLPAEDALPGGLWLRAALYLVPYAIVGWDVLWKALRNIRAGQVFDENFLMGVATLGAFGAGEYPEAVAVMLFYQVGELFQGVAVGRSRQSIAALMDIRPDYANVERGGALVQVDPEEVKIGDTIVVKAGEKIPLDGIVTEGSSSVDTAALTGESLPRDVGPGSEVISGCVNCCMCRCRRNSVIPLWRRFWIWWKTPAAKRRKRNTLSPALPVTIPLPLYLPPWRWRSFLPSSQGSGAYGCSGR